MRHGFIPSACVLLCCVVAGANPGAGARSAPTDEARSVDPESFQALRYRLIGPHRGGRVTTVAGIAADPLIYYMGTSSGGLWKTTNAGTTWFNISDGFFPGSTVGSMALAPSNPDVIYVGTGEAYVRSFIQEGFGVYKSLDAGRTWKSAGLDGSGQIAQVQVHPMNPDIVYVAVLGRMFAFNENRGVFRSMDGGATWRKVLYVSEKTGAVDLAMDVKNPRVLYAAMYQFHVPGPWVHASGGPEGGIFKTTDGGDSWVELEKGLPQGITGRIGVTVSPANSNRVYAVIEAHEGGFFRSDDGGSSFRRMNKERKLLTRMHAFGHIWSDPVDEDTVYVGNVGFYRSTDGGATFPTVRGTHPDYRDLLDQSGEPAQHDCRQRRRRDGHIRWRQDLVDAAEPADGRDVQRDDRHAVPVSRGTAPSTTTPPSRSRVDPALPGGGESSPTRTRSAVVNKATSASTPGTRTPSTPGTTRGSSSTTTTARDKRATSRRIRKSEKGYRPRS